LKDLKINFSIFSIIFNFSMRKELFLEEAVLDDLAEDLEILELPISQRAFRWVTIFFLALIALVMGRLIFISVWQSNFYNQRALMNMSDTITTPSQRGIIFDNQNKPLVENLPAPRLNLNLVEFFKNSSKRDETIKILEDELSLRSGYIDQLLKQVNLEKQNSLTIARQLTIDQVIRIKNLNLSGVEIEDDFKRQYPDGQIFSQIIGYTGFVDKNDLKNNSTLAISDVIGKSGLEASYDKALQGKDGQIINYKNFKGETIDKKLLKNPEPGYQIYTTIDSGLQSYFYNRFQQALNYLGSKAGVGIAMNPGTGEILSLVSLPSFNNNQISGADLNNPNQPFFNRAISGAYAPGSTIKPLVAFAALKENVITPEAQVFSAGYLEIPNPYNPDIPSIFPDWRANGWVDLYSAIARSCNIYFYAVGGGLPNNAQPSGILQGINGISGLGIDKLKDYWQKFGLGQKTGIDLPFENSGFLPDPASKEKNTGDIWRLGDTYHVSIGQGDLLLNPLQLINYISAIANGGKFYQPFIVKKIVSEDGKIIGETNPKVINDYSSDIETFKKIQRGMADAVSESYGTANLLSDLPISVAAKTGTAQIENNVKINAFFVGYLPAENPQIAILVLVENAREGSLNAVPVAKDVLQWYYYNRIMNKE